MHSFLASPKSTIDVLQSFGLYTKKRLGQHFLIDDNVIGRILDAADVGESDQILEIGPGIGVLTVALLQKLDQQQSGHLLAIEYDSQLLEVLEYTTKDSPLLTVLNEDALNIPQLDLPIEPSKLIANLPYQVAATNVLDSFEYIPSLQTAVVMVQKEVALRMAASPGTKTYGAYSAKLQLLARPVSRFDVSKNSFLPPPRVESSVIALRRRCTKDVLVRDIDHYRQVATVIDASFQNRRKTILNNLKQLDLDPALLADALMGAGIDPIARAETLSPADFVRLQDAFALQ